MLTRKFVKIKFYHLSFIIALCIYMYTCLYTYKDLYIQTCITFFLVKRARKFFL